jgi:hypothetical protein
MDHDDGSILKCQVCLVKKAKKGCRACRQFICNSCFGETNHNVHNEELYYPKLKMEIEDLIKEYKPDLKARYDQLKQIEEVTLKEQSRSRINPTEITVVIDKKKEEFIENINEMEKLMDFFRNVNVQSTQFLNNLMGSESGVFKYKANDFKQYLDYLKKDINTFDLSTYPDKLKTITELTNKYDAFIKDSENCLKNSNVGSVENDFKRFKFNLEKVLTNNSFVSEWNSIKSIIAKMVNSQKNLMNQFNEELQNIAKNKDDEVRPSSPKKQPSVLEKQSPAPEKQPTVPEKQPLVPDKVGSAKKFSGRNGPPSQILAESGLLICQNHTYLRADVTLNTVLPLALAESIPVCEFIIGLRNNNTDILVYYKEKIHDLKFTKQYLNNTKFKDKSVTFPFKHSKYVNIGESLVLTGGCPFENTSTNECLVIHASFRNGEVVLSFSDFPTMIDKRERHNMIYLPNYKTILACCNFQTSTSCEIIEISNIQAQWKKINSLTEPRANATMAYVDNRWIYCLSGFKVLGNGGKYLENYEVLDYSSPGKRWVQYSFNTDMRRMSLSAMGVIPYTEDRVLIIGGYDGQKYVNECFTIEFSNGEIKSTSDNETTLQSGVIFTQNSFVKCGNRLLNFDFNNKLIDIGLK